MNEQRKGNDREIRRLKAENIQMEKNVEDIRRHNEKLAKAIRRVKEQPELNEQVRNFPDDE